MKKFQDLSIPSKLFIVFGFSAAFIAAIILIGVFSIVRVKNASKEAYDELFLGAQRLMELEKDFEKSRRALLSMLNERDWTRLQAHLNDMVASSNGVEENLRRISAHGHISQESAERMMKLHGIWRDFKDTRNTLITPAILDGRIKYASTLVNGIQEHRFREFSEIVHTLAVHENAEALAAQTSIEEGYRKSIFQYAVVTLVGFVLAITLLILVTRNIRRRLKVVQNALLRVKVGELDFKIEDKHSDEIGFVITSLNQMIRQLFEDRVMQEQSIAVLQWFSNESVKEVEKLERLNKALTSTQEELNNKNVHLENSLSEIREMNQRIAETQAQMLQSAKMASIGQLSAGVAHELNTPIAFVSSNMNTLSEYIKEVNKFFDLNYDLLKALKIQHLDDARDILQRVVQYDEKVDLRFIIDDIKNIMEESKDGISRVVSIVKGLKEFAHDGFPEKVKCNVNKNIENTLKLCSHELKYKADVEMELGKVPEIICQPQRLNQVFMNIIVNASQAIPDRGKIGVRTFCEGGFLVIKIWDTGSGMSEETRQRIFEPFFTTKPVGVGTGLGMSITYGIIKEHNGTIDVESKLGEGTCFTIRLPLETGYESESNEKAA